MSVSGRATFLAKTSETDVATQQPHRRNVLRIASGGLLAGGSLGVAASESKYLLDTGELDRIAKSRRQGLDDLFQQLLKQHADAVRGVPAGDAFRDADWAAKLDTWYAAQDEVKDLTENLIPRLKHYAGRLRARGTQAGLGTAALGAGGLLLLPRNPD